MRIVVNDIAASSGGALSILKDFYEYVKQNDCTNEWIFLIGGKYIEETSNIKVIVLDKVKSGKLEKLKFDLIYGRKFINKLNPDVVFSMQNIITFGIKSKQIVYVHQALPFQSTKKFSFIDRIERGMAIYQYIIGILIKYSIIKADRVIVQTKWMRDAVIDKTKISKDKIINILPNVDVICDDKHENLIWGQSTAFFYPTSDVIYKNIGCIVQAVKILNNEGFNDFEVKLTISNEQLKKYDYSGDNIICTGKLNRNDVYREYVQSVLLFPSYIETFGYPMAEARRTGALILASNCEFSRELLDGYENAYFFDPFSPDELASLMKRVIDGEITRKPVHENVSAENTWKYVVDEISSLSMQKS